MIISYPTKIHAIHTNALSKKTMWHLLLPLFLLFSCLFTGQYACAKTVISDNAHMLTAEEAEQIRSD